MLRYKANLSVVNSRYGEFERRVLEMMVTQEGRRVPLSSENILRIPTGREIDLWYLLRDGLIQKVGDPSRQGAPLPEGLLPVFEHYKLTDEGVHFVERWMGAEWLEAQTDEE